MIPNAALPRRRIFGGPSDAPRPLKLVAVVKPVMLSATGVAVHVVEAI